MFSAVLTKDDRASVKYSGVERPALGAVESACRSRVSGHDWTKRFTRLVRAFETLSVDKAIFDGELVVEHEGRSNFSSLQGELAPGQQDRLAFNIVDLLSFDGFALRPSPQVERSRVRDMESGDPRPLFYSERSDCRARELFERAFELDLVTEIRKAGAW
jgi:bifunctional non-homologous end joining protein LigD